ncbi:MAG TPA: peptidoglycan-binding protein LysM [Thermoanaerobaculia bacterium]|jgi:osmotically-inducible protein OsmY|nr:peptidoglycan-binding protein LysM [Thermoanaerobaculia bacterium]
MGLISFAKNVGRKLGLGDDDDKKVQGQGPQQGQHAAPTAQQVQDLHDRRKAAALNKLVVDMGFKVQDLGVRVDGDKVTLTGQAPSQEIREKIALLVGNVEGIGSVDDNMTAAQSAPEAQFYEVKSGDTLSKIAKQFYGDSNKYNQIFEANRPMLKDADEIYPGQRLRIPAAAHAGTQA